MKLFDYPGTRQVVVSGDILRCWISWNSKRSLVSSSGAQTKTPRIIFCEAFLINGRPLGIQRPCFHRSIRMFQQEFGAIGIMLPAIDIVSHSQGVLVGILRG